MIFEDNFPQDGDVVKLKESLKVELSGHENLTMKVVIEEGSEGKIIRNYGWYLSVAFKGYEVDIYDIDTYNKYIEWLDDIL